MGLTWAAAWAVGGVLIGVSSVVLPFLPWDAFFAIFDAPLPALAVPGFFGGAIFSLVLGIAARRRRFDDLSLARFGLWGAIGGLLLLAVPTTLIALASGSLVQVGTAVAVLSAPFALLGAASAAGTLAIARRAERGTLGAGTDAGRDRLR